MGAGAEKVLVTFRVEDFNISEGMTLAMTDSGPLSSKIRQVDVPLTHPRPFAPSLENKTLAGNNPTNVCIEGIQGCDIAGCRRPAIRNKNIKNAGFY